jgi:hypothetical protein
MFFLGKFLKLTNVLILIKFIFLFFPASVQGPVPVGLRLRAAGCAGKGLLWSSLRRSPQAKEMVRFHQISGQSSQRSVKISIDRILN